MSKKRDKPTLEEWRRSGQTKGEKEEKKKTKVWIPYKEFEPLNIVHHTVTLHDIMKLYYGTLLHMPCPNEIFHIIMTHSSYVAHLPGKLKILTISKRGNTPPVTGYGSFYANFPRFNQPFSKGVQAAARSSWCVAKIYTWGTARTAHCFSRCAHPLYLLMTFRRWCFTYGSPGSRLAHMCMYVCVIICVCVCVCSVCVYVCVCVVCVCMHIYIMCACMCVFVLCGPI